jgi:hypothetical protein
VKPTSRRGVSRASARADDTEAAPQLGGEERSVFPPAHEVSHGSFQELRIIIF